ncbi:MAG: DNA polymerase I [Flammeovirgaceae bacterium]
MQPKKLFLLDAMALIYRAHFAFSKNPRINSKGLNTGAAFGFTNTLLEILQKEKPTHIGVAFDTPAPTFRHVQFADYKANRQEQPEDITIAIPLVKEIVRAFQIPVIELDGYEADDLIGTLAKKAGNHGFKVYMMTPDKDYGQLVDENIFLYKPAFMGNDVEVMGVKEVLEKWGIEKIEQVVDFLGLQGDTIDNIPGIPGIGEKTARKLLAEYGSVENLVANAEKLTGKLKETVKQFGYQGILSKKLATININSPLEFDEQALLYKGFDKTKLKVIFAELEFKTLEKRLFGEELAPTSKTTTKNIPVGAGVQPSLFGGATINSKNNQNTDIQEDEKESELNATKENLHTVADTPHDYRLIDNEHLRKSLVYYLGLQKEFCFDTETTSLDSYEAELVGISFSYYKGDAYYVPIPADFETAKKIVGEFKEIFENENIIKIGQNLKYDLMVLANYGIQLKGAIYDTMLAHYLLDPESRHNMDALAEKYLHYQPISIEELIGKKGKGQASMRDVEISKIVEYAAEDADITLQLKQHLAPLLAQNQKLDELLKTVEFPLVNVLADIERNGVRIDIEALKLSSGELETEMKVLQKKIYEIAEEEFNIDSPKQLGTILFEKLKLVEKPKKTATGQYATGEEILLTLSDKHEIVSNILEYRQIQKLKSTYIDALPDLISPKDKLIHTSFNQAVAATGRLSSVNPNLQNIPIRTAKGRQIRKAFVPRSEDFILMSADYSQVELRIMASFSKDEVMIEAFRQKKDIHAATAAKIFKVELEKVDGEMRRKAKTANFGIIYGISAFGLSQRLNIGRKEAAEIIEAYFKEFPSVKKYMDDIVQFAREHEYVETLMGRRRYLRDINSKNHTNRSFAERNAINTPIQGTAADLIKKAMVDIYSWMKKEKVKSKMILQVHDELLFDVHHNEKDLMAEKIPYFMENALKMEVPLEVEIGFGKNWLEAH